MPSVLVQRRAGSPIKGCSVPSAVGGKAQDQGSTCKTTNEEKQCAGHDGPTGTRASPQRTPSPQPLPMALAVRPSLLPQAAHSSTAQLGPCASPAVEGETGCNVTGTQQQGPQPESSCEQLLAGETRRPAGCNLPCYIWGRKPSAWLVTVSRPQPGMQQDRHTVGEAETCWHTGGWCPLWPQWSHTSPAQPGPAPLWITWATPGPSSPQHRGNGSLRTSS